MTSAGPYSLATILFEPSCPNRQPSPNGIKDVLLRHFGQRPPFGRDVRGKTVFVGRRGNIVAIAGRMLESSSIESSSSCMLLKSWPFDVIVNSINDRIYVNGQIIEKTIVCDDGVLYCINDNG